MYWHESDVGLHSSGSSKLGGGALVVIPNVNHVPETSSPTLGNLDDKK